MHDREAQDSTNTEWRQQHTENNKQGLDQKKGLGLRTIVNIKTSTIQKRKRKKNH